MNITVKSSARFAFTEHSLRTGKLVLILIILFLLVIGSDRTIERSHRSNDTRSTVRMESERNINQTFENVREAERTAFYVKGVQLWM